MALRVIEIGFGHPGRQVVRDQSGDNATEVVERGDVG
jgi:hypothetical protein